MKTLLTKPYCFFFRELKVNPAPWVNAVPLVNPVALNSSTRRWLTPHVDPTDRLEDLVAEDPPDPRDSLANVVPVDLSVSRVTQASEASLASVDLKAQQVSLVTLVLTDVFSALRRVNPVQTVVMDSPGLRVNEVTEVSHTLRPLASNLQQPGPQIVFFFSISRT